MKTKTTKYDKIEDADTTKNDEVQAIDVQNGVSEFVPFGMCDMILPMYLPTLFFSFADYICVPIIPLFIYDNLHLDGVHFGIATLSRGVGTFTSNFFIGHLSDHMGTKSVMLISEFFRALSGLLIFCFPNFFILCIGMFIEGLSEGGWIISRSVFLSVFTIRETRGKLIATMTGLRRVASMIGPIFSALLLKYSNPRWGFLVRFVCSLPAIVLVYWNVPSEHLKESARKKSSSSTISMCSKYAGFMFYLGIYIFITCLIRETRKYVLTLAIHQTELNDEYVGFVNSFSFMIDVLCVPLAGIIMDKYGRKYTAVPYVGFMSLGFAFLLLTSGFWGVLIAGGIMGLGNGIGSGVITTMSVDLAPDEDRSSFLSTFRLYDSTGRLLGPFLLGIMIDNVGFDAAVSLYVVIGIFGTIWVSIMVSEQTDKFTFNETQSDKEDVELTEQKEPDLEVLQPKERIQKS